MRCFCRAIVGRVLNANLCRRIFPPSGLRYHQHLIVQGEYAMTSITIELPDDVARRAASLGLFTPEKIRAWLEFETRRVAGNTLAASLAKVRHLPGETMSDIEVAEQLARG